LYDSQHKLLDTGFPYVVYAVLKNGTLPFGTALTVADIFTGGLSEVYLHAWVGASTAGTITFSFFDLNQASYSAQQNGETVTAAMEIIGGGTDAGTAITAPNGAILKHTANINSDLTRITYTTSGGSGSVTKVYLYLLGKPFNRGA
jgi:hypothetical protein